MFLSAAQSSADVASRFGHARVRQADPGPACTDLERLLSRHDIRCVYQPIVDLYSESVVGYEALARGPFGSALERPEQLFAAAGAEGHLAELDRVCRIAAVTGATWAGMRSPWTLFVNTEPGTAGDALQPDRHTNLHGLPAERWDHRQRIVMELTERALTTNPLQLLRLVTRIRARGWGIALDDLGADPRSLALLPLLKPDVIKLDARLVQQHRPTDLAEILSAVNAEVERSGSIILAEGIETEQHRCLALSLGATLGQGWLLGRPGPLPTPLPPFTEQPIPIIQPPIFSATTSLFAQGTAMRRPRPAPKTLLIEISKFLEQQAIRSGPSTVVLAAFQDARFLTPATRRRYAKLARSAAFLGILGEGMPCQPLPGVRGGNLAADDDLVNEWIVAVIGPHFAAVLLARDQGDQPSQRYQRYEYILSHNRDLAIQVTSQLMARIGASPAGRLADEPGSCLNA